MTRILFIGDVHVKQDNGNEIDILSMEIERIFKTSEHKYDFIILGGDVMHYHERLFTQSLNKSLEFIKKLTELCNVYILVGNHDYINNSQFLTENHWMNAIKEWKNVTIIDKIFEIGNIMFCPYVPPGRFIEALETKTKEWKSKKIIFAHQEFRGCKMGAIESVDGDEWLEYYPFVVSGHIHDNQKVGNNIYYPGTPLQHAFGDSDKKIVCDLYISDENDKDEKEIEIRDIDLNVPKKYVLKTDSKNIKQVIKKLKEDMLDVSKTDKLKLKLDMSTDEFNLFKDTKDYKELLQKGVKIQLQKKKSSDSDEKEENNENDDNKNINFVNVLEKLVYQDEILVQKLYQEIINK